MSDSPKMLHGFRHSTNMLHSKMAGCTQPARYCDTCKQHKAISAGHKRLPKFKCAECVRAEQSAPGTTEDAPS